MNFNPAEGGGGPCFQGGIVWNSHIVPRWSQAEFMFSDFLFLVLMVLSWAVTLGKCTSSAKALNFQNLCILLWSAISPRVGLLIDKCVMTKLRTASSRLGGRVFSGYYDRGLGRDPTGTSLARSTLRLRIVWFWSQGLWARVIFPFKEVERLWRVAVIKG